MSLAGPGIDTPVASVGRRGRPRTGGRLLKALPGFVVAVSAVILFGILASAVFALSSKAMREA